MIYNQMQNNYIEVDTGKFNYLMCILKEDVHTMFKGKIRFIFFKKGNILLHIQIRYCVKLNAW